MGYNFHKNFSIFLVKDPSAIDHNKRRPMVILFRHNGDCILAKITTKYKEVDRYCCVLDEWLEAGLDRPSCIRLDKFVNMKEDMLPNRDYIGCIGDTDTIMIQSMLSSLYNSTFEN